MAQSPQANLGEGSAPVPSALRALHFFTRSRVAAGAVGGPPQEGARRVPCLGSRDGQSCPWGLVVLVHLRSLPRPQG